MKKQILKGKTTLITGASEGIGRATAVLFASEGSDLFLLARNEQRLDMLKAELEAAYGISCIVLPADVSNIAELQNILATISVPDIAIINAGVGQYGPVSHTLWNEMNTVLRTNIDGALATAHALLPDMIARRSGSIVFVSSSIGKRSIPYNATYCASKFALQGFADALRLEVRPFGIHVGSICPARTDTEFFRRSMLSVPQTKQRRLPTNPPEQVAKDILYNVLNKRRETVVSCYGKLFSFFGYHFPRLSDVLLSKAVPSPTQNDN